MGRIKKTGYYKNTYFNNLAYQAISDLAKLGKRLVNEAVRKGSREYNNVLYNLRDSIGCAVYFKGKLVPNTRYYADPHPRSKGVAREGYTGRQAIDEFFEANQNINTKNTIHLVIVAAMPYAEYLEKGTSGRGEQIRVISQITDDLENNMPEYKQFRPKLVAITGGAIR